ncbi:MAG: SEC-C metal-binding domain-containing protein, partial [Promethearchaeota archaeon]
MQLKRNDLCYCGSNKKYKNCCWSKDRVSSYHKKVNFLRVQAIAEIKKNPRGYIHWNLTNKILDEIIKDKLKDAPLLKYRPEAWIQPLYKAYFLLRSDYWRIIYAT